MQEKKKEERKKKTAEIELLSYLLLYCWEITSAACGPTSFWQVLTNKL